MVVYKFWHGSGSLIFVFGKITAFLPCVTRIKDAERVSMGKVRRTSIERIIKHK